MLRRLFKKFTLPLIPLSFILFYGYGCDPSGEYGCDPSGEGAMNTENIIELPPIAQVGVVVNDVDKAVKHYTQLGLGPFNVMEVEVDGFIYKGKPAPHKLKLGMSTKSPQIELIETLEGETPNTDFLREHGEGVSHYAFNVSLEEYEAILAAWAKRGIQPIFYRDEPDRKIAYLNTDGVGGIMTELVGTKMP